MGRVKIEGMTFAESEYRRGNKVWKAQTLYDFAKAKECEMFHLPLAAIRLDGLMFNVRNLREFIFQMSRVNLCSLDHPIILDDFGQVADGWHRVCLAIITGEETIRAIRLDEMPAPDYTYKEGDEDAESSL